MSFEPLDEDFYESNRAKDIYIRATFGQRTLAYVFDNLLINCLVLWCEDLRLQLSLTILYISIELFTGASLGKRVMKLKIMSLDKEEVDILDYAKRIGFKYCYVLVGIFGISFQMPTLMQLSLNLPIFILIASLFALRANKLTLYDQLFGTTVFAINKAYNRHD